MPPIVVSFLGFPLMLALLAVVHVVVRNASRRALGARDVTNLLWKRVLATSLGAFASYVVCALLFLVAMLGFGQQESTLRMTVMPSSPAYEAGLRDGDRVVALNGVQPASWEEVRFMIEEGAGAPIGMEVERAGQTLRFEVQPRDGRIGVMSITERHDLSLAGAAAIAIPSPVFTIFTWAQELARNLTQPRTLMGPVAYALVAREPSLSPWEWLWPLLFRLGALGSYAWPFSMLIVFLAGRRRRQV